METDEMRKRGLPYVVNSALRGFTALVTIQGRPPLCLRCRVIGHIRKDCVPSRPSDKGKTYAKAVSNVQADAVTGNATGDVTGDVTDDTTGDMTNDVTGEQQDQQKSQTGHTDGESQGQNKGSDDHVMTDSLKSTSSTIPPNRPKRTHGGSDDDDDDDDNHGGLMIDEDRVEDYQGFMTGKRSRHK